MLYLKRVEIPLSSVLVHTLDTATIVTSGCQHECLE